ncbi:alpha/beta hydrolase [Azospirillum halopraeferens]|uniref:alpha/beta hydrolase n=1 Tax=Azospirillum halopraeferens TaxID=34010 RepID=UPI0004028800|nr:alpha/beta hydrolase [Azospirillum halopraeferens]
MPTLELISRRPAAAAPVRRPPLLFVHGAFCGAWIWDATFLPWFAERGWEAHAVSLRGHGGSDGHDGLRWHGVSDYVEDVLATIDRLSEPPVLIGHSMGGLVIQRALLRRSAPAAVLMASTPPHGLMEASLGFALRDPYAFQQMGVLMACGSRHVDPEGIRRAMFSDRMPHAEAERYEPLLQEESQRVLFETMGWNPFPAIYDRTIPSLVIGAERDILIPPDHVTSTARLFGTDPVIMPGRGHAMMLEPGWDEVAGLIHDWLERTLALRDAA